MKQEIFKTLNLLFVLTIFCVTSLSAQHKGSTPLNEPAKEELALQKRNQLAMNALAKISSEERTAIISLLSDVSEAASVTAKSSRKSKSENAKLEEAIREMLNHQKFQPLKWMAADGSTFASRGEYLQYQWGVPYPSETNPYDPFE